VSPYLQIEELHSIPSTPARYGVMGHPVAHSLSPQMQLAGFNALQRPAQYVRIDVPPEKLAEAVATLRRENFCGWNCTLPNKVALSDYMDDLGQSARQLKAVNTVVRENDRLTGFNTDGDGWVRAIREEFSVDVRDLKILILGAGGAGQALARQAALEGCERLVLVNRNLERARQLADELDPSFHSTKLIGAHDRLKVIPFNEEEIAEELNSIDLVINATSLGLKTSDPAVLSSRILQPHLLVYDTIYRPARTRLIQAAQEAGCRVANGLSMLLHQGALSLELWTGETAPLEAMRKALHEAAA
jgi:shikimate dehydrogenase